MERNGSIILSDNSAVKICLDCELPQPRTAFAFDRSRKDSLLPYCRDCFKKQREARKLGLRLRILIPLTDEMSQRVIALRRRLRFRRIDLAAHIGCGEAAIRRLEQRYSKRATLELWQAIEEMEKRNI